MKKIKLLIITFCSISIGLQAQTTAQNWTKTDCDGNSHTLFDYLNNGKVVILQFDMMNCIPCTSAATATNGIFKRFQVSNPGKVLMFSMGYNSSTLCSQMQSWKSTNNFSFTTIEKCPNEVNYYGGMGMPTIVVLGGFGKVLYNKQGFNPSDTTAIKNAILGGLATSGVAGIETHSGAAVAVSPNPAQGEINLDINLPSGQGVEVDIYDISGKEVLHVDLGELASGGHTMSVSVDRNLIGSGLYFIRTNIEGSAPIKLYLVD